MNGAMSGTGVFEDREGNEACATTLWCSDPDILHLPAQYAGEWDGNARHGRGLMMWRTGASYDGGFEDVSVSLSREAAVIILVYPHHCTVDSMTALVRAGLPMAKAAEKW